MRELVLRENAQRVLLYFKIPDSISVDTESPTLVQYKAQLSTEGPSAEDLLYHLDSSR